MTPTLENQPMNVYDAVLGECQDLLNAALEAQRLGRLKMASAYQLLLHTRLVGLGKRFDRSDITSDPKRRRGNDNDEDDDDEDDEEVEGDDDDEDEDDDDDEDGGNNRYASDEEHRPKSRARRGGLKMDDSDLPETGSTHGKSSSGTKPGFSGIASVLPQALEKLTAILPSNLEMDVSMMEHLARAAVELHHQRTGRKKSAEGLLASPMGGLIGTPSPAAVVESAGGTNVVGAAASSRKGNARIAWSTEEQKIVERALGEKKAPYAIAKLLKNKTEAQVKAFIKNQAKSEEQTNAWADDLGGGGGGSGGGGSGGGGSPSKKRGGRGRKPPTTAMNTMPNANLDAKSLLQGMLKRE